MKKILVFMFCMFMAFSINLNADSSQIDGPQISSSTLIDSAEGASISTIEEKYAQDGVYEINVQYANGHESAPLTITKKALENALASDQINTIVVNAISKDNKKTLYKATIDVMTEETIEDCNITIYLSNLLEKDTTLLSTKSLNGLTKLTSANKCEYVDYIVNVDGIADGTYFLYDSALNVVKQGVKVSGGNLAITAKELSSSNGVHYLTSNYAGVQPSVAPSTTPQKHAEKVDVVYKTENGSGITINGKNYEDVIKNTINSNAEIKKELISKNPTVTIEGKKFEMTEKQAAPFQAVVPSGVLVSSTDITINMNVRGKNYLLSELTGEIELSMPIPKTVEPVKNEYVREYYVLRDHNGTIEKLDTTLSEDGNSVIFSSDKFSNYVLGYVDTLAVSNPQTGDNMMFYMVVLVITLITFIKTANYFKENN